VLAHFRIIRGILDGERIMKIHVLERDIWIAKPLDAIFAFFSDAHNLNEITPPWLNFEILTPAPIHMAVGTIIDYQLRLRGKKIRWQTEIAHWEPPHKFVDAQRHGPYRLWIHEHVFVGQNDGTQIHDRVRYAVPGGVVEPLVHRLFVARELTAIFEYREDKLQTIFAS